jgi:UDP-N-acetyl-D-glucosamine dehydrogenase
VATASVLGRDPRPDDRAREGEWIPLTEGDWKHELDARISERRARVVVIGLGFVGWPLALRAAEAGYSVTGVDTDKAVVDERAAEAARANPGKLVVSPDTSAVRDADVVAVCVPTPLSSGVPDLANVMEVASALASHMTAGTLVSLESTTYPGTTEEVFRKKLESGGLAAGRDFALAYSPERIDPGGHGIDAAPKLVSGLTESCGDLAMSFYSSLVPEVVRVARPREAELAKLLENTYRQVNIALINEFAMVAHDLDIDIWEVVRAAATKPFGFQSFTPGIGIGGHCIAVDPVYLTWRIRELGREPFRIVELAREVDAAMPAYVVSRINGLLKSNGIEHEGASVTVLGVTYKPDVADTRESRAIEIMELLVNQGTRVVYNDPYCPELSIAGTVHRSTPVEAALDSDLVTILTHHSSYDYEDVIARSRLVFDARGVTVDMKGDHVHRL